MIPKSYKKTHLGNRKLSPETQMMHYGYEPKLSEGSVKCPQFQTSTFAFESAKAGKQFFDYVSGRVPLPEGVEPGLIYSRFNNPNTQILEERISLWDKTEDCIVTNSGMSAITTTLLSFCKPGNVIVYSEPIYGGTDTLINGILLNHNIKAVGFTKNHGDDSLRQAVSAAERLGTVSAVLIETPSNPNSSQIDIADCALVVSELKKKQECVLIVDNTMCGPVFQHPTLHGADICIYSLTKYAGGHSDLIGGSVSGSHQVIQKIRKYRNTIGATMDAYTAWLMMRSLETLMIRMRSSAESALKIAHFLGDHPKVKKVNHVELFSKDDPQYAIYQKQCSGSGSTFSFEVDSDEEGSFRFLDTLQVINLAVSLGATETLAQHPASMTHSGVRKERRNQIGITDNLIRLSVGLENTDDLIADLDQALITV